jgi:HD-like signal output (HDOD) protein
MPQSSQIAAMDRLIDRLDRLHTAPQVACQILTILQDEDFETHELVECLENDPALATSVLRLVNSSYFGLPRNVASLQHAVAYLGSRSLRLAVLSFGLLKQLLEDTPAELYQDYWRRSLTMASVASRLARFRKELAPDEAYSAGLLSDVGLLLLAQLETKSYVPMYKRMAHAEMLIESERELYGFHHGDLGARLLERWNLPPRLVEAVAEHHALSEPCDLLVHATYVSNLMADALWTPHSSEVNEVRLLLESEYGLDMDGFITLAVDCKEIIRTTAAIYQVQLSGHIDCEELVNAARARYMEEAMEAAIDWDSLAAVARQEEIF